MHPAPGAHISTAGCTIFGGVHPECARFFDNISLLHIRWVHWGDPGCTVLGEVHPVDAQNKILISDTGYILLNEQPKLKKRQTATQYWKTTCQNLFEWFIYDLWSPSVLVLYWHAWDDWHARYERCPTSWQTPPRPSEDNQHTSNSVCYIFWYFINIKFYHEWMWPKFDISLVLFWNNIDMCLFPQTSSVLLICNSFWQCPKLIFYFVHLQGALLLKLCTREFLHAPSQWVGMVNSSKNVHTPGAHLRKSCIRWRKCARRVQGAPLISDTVWISIPQL